MTIAGTEEQPVVSSDARDARWMPRIAWSALAVSLVGLVVVAAAAPRGFEFSDEGWSLLAARSPKLFADQATPTRFQYMTGDLYRLVGENLIWFRIGKLLIITAAAALFAFAVLRLLVHMGVAITRSDRVLVAAIVVVSSYGANWLPQSPSYNDVALVAHLLFAAAIIGAALSLGRSIRAPGLLLGVAAGFVSWFAVMNKFSGSVALVVLAVAVPVAVRMARPRRCAPVGRARRVRARGCGPRDAGVAAPLRAGGRHHQRAAAQRSIEPAGRRAQLEQRVREECPRVAVHRVLRLARLVRDPRPYPAVTPVAARRPGARAVGEPRAVEGDAGQQPEDQRRRRARHRGGRDRDRDAAAGRPRGRCGRACVPARRDHVATCGSCSAALAVTPFLGSFGTAASITAVSAHECAIGALAGFVLLAGLRPDAPLLRTAYLGAAVAVFAVVGIALTWQYPYNQPSLRLATASVDSRSPLGDVRIQADRAKAVDETLAALGPIGDHRMMLAFWGLQGFTFATDSTAPGEIFESSERPGTTAVIRRACASSLPVVVVNDRVRLPSWVLDAIQRYCHASYPAQSDPLVTVPRVDQFTGSDYRDDMTVRQLRR